MAWTTPRTWVSGETVTAALMNTHVRDNLLETAAPSVSAAGSIPYADGNNSVGSELTISGTSGQLMVSTGSAPAWRAQGQSENGQNYATDGVSGANFYNPLDDGAWANGSGSASLSVSLTTGISALVFVGCSDVTVDDTTTYARISYAVSGATTIASSNRRSASGVSHVASKAFNLHRTFFELNTLTAGTNVFTFEAIPYSTGTITLFNPHIAVVAL